MIKKIFLFLLILAIAGAAAVYFFGSSALNKGIKTAVEKFGPEVTQTAVRLDDVNISVLSGNGTLTGLYVGNPDGYENENIFALGEIDVDIDTGSVFSDKIIINKIHIKKPEISYEKTLLSSNIKALLNNIEEFSGSSDKTTPEPEAGTPAESGPSKQVVIKQLIIEDGTIFVGLMGNSTTVPLPRIEMNDIGETGNKKSMAEVIDLVLTEVLKSIGPAIAESGDGEGVINKATDSIKGLFGK
ncbi:MULTISPECIES: hypothetical protein [unclassified Lentimonas]|uniref:hypothetical protein n=1 Tax=unclassified Lentimonas TaxID=2630993 RepID=UPI001323E174|nr:MULTISPECIES: hypothetical protein [unclassified Lentimonas]CAA6691619.1 Unannotated [Lentimonas sp. CC10]CAA6696282.1 Unannotated [Lentimonas sp. CC19]CAA7070843.1 Unannotated [Lentimonas sp. CC11]